MDMAWLAEAAGQMTKAEIALCVMQGALKGVGSGAGRRLLSLVLARGGKVWEWLQRAPELKEGDVIEAEIVEVFEGAIAGDAELREAVDAVVQEVRREQSVLTDFKAKKNFKTGDVFVTAPKDGVDVQRVISNVEFEGDAEFGDITVTG